MKHKTIIAQLLISVLLLAACGPAPRQRTVAVMDDVETYINERPDSALAALTAVDTTSLTTRALRARYSLLRVMALDKCYEDITVPGLLDPAVAWYARHGSADEKMKTLYYQGRIAQDKKDRNNAALFFVRAEEYAERVKDEHALALLLIAEATVYNDCYNLDKELEYWEKALAVLKQSQSSMYESVLGGLAYVYHSQKEWSKADSLYRIAVSHSDAYPHALEQYLSNYARMKVLQPDKDPEGAIELLDRKRDLLGGGLTPKEAGAYAYALELTGNHVAASRWKAQLERLTGQARFEVLSWLMRMARLEGDSEAAFMYLAEARSEEEKIISTTMSESVVRTLQGYYEQSARREREHRLRLGIYALIAVIFLLSLTVVLLIRGNKTRAERDRLLSLRAELERDLLEQESRSAAMSDDFSSRLEALRLQLGRERLDRLRRGGRYSYWMWMEQNGRSSDAHIINGLRKEFQEVCALEKDTRALERRLNADLDGIVSHLKADLEIREHTEDEKFLCYWLIDLKPDMIAELLGISNNYVYVKTHRLEKRIRDLGKAEYMPLIQKNLTKSL